MFGLLRLNDGVVMVRGSADGAALRLSNRLLKSQFKVRED